MGINQFESLAVALEALKQKGFTAEFSVDRSGAHSDSSRAPVNPEDATVVEYHRFEGSSNPDDMAVVYALELKDGTRGTLIDAYGTYANPLSTEFIKRLRMKEGLR